MVVDGAMKLSVACVVAHANVNDAMRAKVTVHTQREESTSARLSRPVSMDALLSNVERMGLF